MRFLVVSVSRKITSGQTRQSTDPEAGWAPAGTPGSPQAELPRAVCSPVLKMLWAFALPSFAAWMRWSAPTASSFGTDIPSTKSWSSVWAEARRSSSHSRAAAAPWEGHTYNCVCGQQAPKWEDDHLFSHLQSFVIIINIHLPKRPLLPGYTSSKTSLTRKSSLASPFCIKQS